MTPCTRCGSYAINPHCHGRNDIDLDLCDVCYWRKRAEHADNRRLSDPGVLDPIRARIARDPAFARELLADLARRLGDKF